MKQMPFVQYRLQPACLCLTIITQLLSFNLYLHSVHCSHAHCEFTLLQLNRK